MTTPDQADSIEVWVRKIFEKHSMEKSPELELFDTDAIIEEIAHSIQALCNKQVVLGRIDELKRTASRFEADDRRYLDVFVDKRIAELAPQPHTGKDKK